MVETKALIVVSVQNQKQLFRCFDFARTPLKGDFTDGWIGMDSVEILPYPRPCQLLKQVHCGKDEEHVVGRAAAEDVLDLLPQVWEHQKFREVRSDQCCSGNHSARNV